MASVRTSIASRKQARFQQVFTLLTFYKKRAKFENVENRKKKQKWLKDIKSVQKRRQNVWKKIKNVQKY